MAWTSIHREVRTLVAGALVVALVLEAAGLVAAALAAGLVALALAAAGFAAAAEVDIPVWREVDYLVSTSID